MTATDARWPHRIQVFSVVSVAVVAAVGSYAHMYELARSVGEGTRSYLLPISVDGMVVAASMTMYVRRRQGRKVGFLAPFAFVVGLGASVAANIASAEPTLEGRGVAAFAPVALMIAYELMLGLAKPDQPRAPVVAPEPSLQARVAKAQAEPTKLVASPPARPVPEVAPPTSGPDLPADFVAAGQQVVARRGEVPPWKVLAEDMRADGHKGGTEKFRRLQAVLAAGQNGSSG